MKTKYDVRAIPVRKGDTVKVVRGTFKGREGKVQSVYRKRWCLHVEKITKEKTNGNISSAVQSLFRFPSANPHSSFKVCCHSTQAWQKQKSFIGEKEESCQAKEQA